MKLHELVFLRNELMTSIDLSVIEEELRKNQSRLDYLKGHSNDYYKNKLQQISGDHIRALEVAKEDVVKVKQVIDELNQAISAETKRFFQDNYQTECLFNDPYAIRNIKKMVMADGTEEFLLSRIQLHSTWEYPAMEIGCRDGEWTKHLVSFDPLYLVDLHQMFLRSAAGQFTPEYQARLRQYLMTNDFRVQGLPQHQFGFIFSFNFFNYLSLDTIKQILLQAKDWLRPGGTMIFTYNNADLSASAGMSEGYFMTYVPKSMLVPMIESIGFEVVAATDYLPSTSWIEIRKPGELKTIKAHQCLGEIKYYSV